MKTFERVLAGEVNGLDEKKLDLFVEKLVPTRAVSLLQALLRKISREQGLKLHLSLDASHEVLIEVREVP